MTDLNFQSFGNDFSVNSTNEQSGAFSGNFDRDRNTLVDDNVSTTGTGKNIFSLSFYQQFFDVDTDQVVKRILNSVVPTNNNFILDFVQPLPDLWGPFWISVTLVFSIGIFGNIAQYIENDGASGNYGSDFRLVTSASFIIFLYVILVPLGLFGILWHRKSDLQYPYIDIVCAYGYSLTIFIPVSLLWMLNVNWFRWVLIFTSVALSGGVLAKAIYPAFKNDTNRMVAFGSVITVFLLHFLLAFAFKEMFFDAVHPLVPSTAASQIAVDAPSSAAASNSSLLPPTPSLPVSVTSLPLAAVTSPSKSIDTSSTSSTTTTTSGATSTTVSNVTSVVNTTTPAITSEITTKASSTTTSASTTMTTVPGSIPSKVKATTTASTPKSP